MTSMQAWLILGIPVLVAVGGLFTGRSSTRSTLGFLMLSATFVFFITYVGDTTSAAVLGTIAALLIATGRGTVSDDAEPQHHEDRERFTSVAKG